MAEDAVLRSIHISDKEVLGEEVTAIVEFLPAGDWLTADILKNDGLS